MRYNRKDRRNNQILSEEERKQIKHNSQHGLCQCGHEKNNHSKFIDGMFKGCQLCNCQEFEWPKDNKKES